MNRELADAEQSRNPLSVEELTVRMEKWLSEGWQAVLFEIDGGRKVVGYAVFQIGRDYYEPAIPEVYIRQFYITEQHRRQGLGRRAFALLVAEQLPAGSRVHLDVLSHNARAQEFWASLGFRPYSVAMRYVPNANQAPS